MLHQNSCGNKIVCDLCGKEFYRYQDFERHYNAHKTYSDIKRQWECKKCNNFFTTEKILIKHMFEKHGEQYSVECDICGKKFSDTYKLMGHKTKVHTDAISKMDFGNIVKKRILNPKYWENMKKMGEQRKGKNNPVFKDPNTIKKMGIGIKAWWDNMPEEERIRRITIFKNAPYYDGNLVTKCEKEIISFQIPNVEYTGDGKFWVRFKNGKNKNPDFIVYGQKKVIEVGDFEYWHTIEEKEEVIAEYEKIGYKCLYIDALKIDEEEIKTFVSNHDCVVKKVKKFGNKSIKHVYNLEVEDNHNYFANNVLVSNCHVIGLPGRGDKSEIGIIQYLENHQQSRILFLSATLPNVGDLKDWIENLTERETKVIKSDYRPCKLNVSFESFVAKGSYSIVEEKRLEKVIELVQKHKNESIIIFVGNKKFGNNICNELSSLQIPHFFHSADLGREERNKIENSFKNKEFNVLIATSTMAWGTNTPVSICHSISYFFWHDTYASMQYNSIHWTCRSCRMVRFWKCNNCL